jgi:hypothetical protein
VEDRVCSSCHGLVAATDVACRHCGVSLRATARRPGTFLNDFFRLLLGVSALTLPAYCLWLGFTLAGAKCGTSPIASRRSADGA